MRRFTSLIFPTFEPRYMKYKHLHLCSLNLGSESMLPKESKNHKLCHWMKKQALISAKHPETWQHFVSYPSMLAERQRHVYEGGTYIIHPLSRFSLYWSSLMILINLAHMTIAPFRLVFLVDVWPAEIWTLDYVMLALHLICLLDIIIKFNVGFRENNTCNYVLKRQKIALKYMCSWFFPDVCSSLPLAIGLVSARAHRRYILLAHCLPFLRSSRIITCYKDIKVFMKAMITGSYIWQHSTRHVMLMIVTTHWCNCFFFVCPVFFYYWYGYMHDGYNVSLKSFHGELLNVSVGTRYKFAFYLSSCAIFSTGYNKFQSYSNDEIVVNAIIILFSSVFLVYSMALMLKLYLTKYNSELRYNELMSQVEKYMRQKLFPAQMKKRVRDFYNYTYQGRYFKEGAPLNCLSEQLRSEISLHSCQRLLENASLFENIPASVVGAVLGCLRAEVYMPNDVILRAGDPADSIYFISSGTVAVYSLKGAEVCHLHDGEYFGVLALLMKDQKRAATVVAIEITQIYRLEERYFRQYVLTNKEMSDRVEMMVSQRMHETVLIDEAFRQHTY